jgi:hypothetical protein
MPSILRQIAQAKIDLARQEGTMLTERERDSLDSVIGRIESLLSNTDTRLHAAQSNPDLSPVGRLNRSAELRQEFATKLEEITGEYTTNIQKNIDAITSTLTPEPPSKDTAEVMRRELVEQEVRRELRALFVRVDDQGIPVANELALHALLLDAANRPEASMLFAAIAHDPLKGSSLALLRDDALIEQFRDTQLEAANPKVFKTKRELEVIHDAVIEVRNEALHEIGVTDTAPDPVRAAAGE